MKSLKGTKTEENLKAAFAKASAARRLAAADRHRAEGMGAGR